ncbi:hypothetical protein SAMN06295967_110111 [Belliella buryatensis]|uniref:Uncharacterized protein n=1 Tax=Belliella buryatensis TaxID=1500549 RepID=A0A239ET67_9BACT|nr:hypothetical protein [Belliella buryatensis]SNS47845.1 hypothetical protein SAMN06295967_110111 [Belliella buryatensis]
MVHKFSDREVKFAQYIKENTPHKIWFGYYIDYAFDFGSFYIKLECILEDVDSPHIYSEAKIVRLTKHDEVFVPEEYTKLICQKKNIECLFITRAMLHFSLFEEYSKTKQIFNRLKQKSKILFTGKQDYLGDMFAKVDGCYETFISHPLSINAKDVNPEFSNLVDCGLLIQIEGKMLKAFVEDNSYGFHVFNDKYFFAKEEIKEIYDKYELIEI